MIEQATTRTWMSDFTPDSDIPQPLSWQTHVSTRVVDEITRRLPEGMPDDDRRRTVYGALEGELRRLSRHYRVTTCDPAAGGLPVWVPFAEAGLRWRWTRMTWAPRLDAERLSQLVSATIADGVMTDLPSTVLLKLMHRWYSAGGPGGEMPARNLLFVEDIPTLLQPRD